MTEKPAPPSDVGELYAKATARPWQAFNMVHAERGDGMTAEEIGEYVAGCVQKSKEDGGSDDFLFVSEATADGPDLCHVGNGPRGPWNAALIVHAVNNIEALEAQTADLTARLDEVTSAFDEAAEARDEAGFLGSPADCIKCLSDEVRDLTTRLERARALMFPAATVLATYGHVHGVLTETDRAKLRGAAEAIGQALTALEPKP